MSWARLDDKFHGNPKVLQASLPALGLYALGLSYCADQLTDGHLSRKVVAGWKGWKPAADDLVAVGLWEETPLGYTVHDYLQWNASREQVVRERSDAAERKRVFRERRTAAGRNGDATRDSGPPIPTPTPIPRQDVTKVTSPAPLNPLIADGGPDVAPPRAAATDHDESPPQVLRNSMAICPLCRLPYQGPYLDHTAEKHRVNSEAGPGNLGQHLARRRRFRGETPTEAVPAEVQEQLDRMQAEAHRTPEQIANAVAKLGHA